MIDPDIENKVNAIKTNVDAINELMADLHTCGVEIRISYQDSAKGNPPTVNLWRATEHVDYLKRTHNEET